MARVRRAGAKFSMSLLRPFPQHVETVDDPMGDTVSISACEAGRVQALIDYEVLDTGAEACFDRISQAAADLCGTSMALISLVDDHRQWFKANVGIPVTETGRDIAFCDHAIGHDGIFTVADAMNDARFADNPLVTGPLGIRFYAGAPLVTPAGHRIGTLCVLDTVPRPQRLSGREQSVLQAMAAQVITELELRLSLRRGEAQRLALERSTVQLAVLQKLVADALDGSGIKVWEWDATNRQVAMVDHTMAGANLATLAEPDRLRWIEDVHPEDLAIVKARASDYFNDRSAAFECEIRVLSDAGEWSWQLIRGGSTERGPDGRAIKVSGTLTNIDARRRAQDQLHWAVHHDALTGLPNRRLFHERLEAALRDAEKQGPGGRVGVALLDLDLFKQVNDVFGHAAGDALLQAIARRLQAFLRPGEICARLGGDEFTVILPDCGCDGEIEDRLIELLDTLREPYDYEGHMLDCRASIGFTRYPDHGSDAGTLLKNADLAMFRSKTSGRGMMTGYNPALSFEMERRVSVLETVRTAMRTDSIAPFFQAQVNAASGAVIGFEALVRIMDGDRIVYLPAMFEDVFDDADLGTAIGRRMLRQVVDEMAGWIKLGVPFGHVAVNASAVELRRADYADFVLETLASAGVPASCLHIEVVETVFLGRGAERVEDTVHRLSSAGVQIALDDFGTGFASLVHLRKFPIDIIKIDKSFVSDVELRGDNIAIVAAVIGLADKLGIGVVAEGVETAGQAAVLLANGCRVLQGYYFHRPCPAAEVPATSLLTLGAASLGYGGVVHDDGAQSLLTDRESLEQAPLRSAL